MKKSLLFPAIRLPQSGAALRADRRFPLSLDAADGKIADQPFLKGEKHDENGQQHQHGARHAHGNGA